MLEAPVPQYLHSYRDLSSPSYSACLPLLGPRGWRWQEPAVRLETDEALVPQCLQYGIELGGLWDWSVVGSCEVWLAGEAVKAARPTRTRNLRHEVAILRPVQDVDVPQIRV